MSQKFLRRCIGMFIFSVCFFPLQMASALTDSRYDAMPGDYIKIDGSPAIYYITPNFERQYFSSAWIFKCYQSDYTSVKLFPKNTDLDSYFPSASPGVVPPTKNCGLVKSVSSPSVYAFDENGIRHKIKDEATAQAMFGSSWVNLVHDMPDFIFSLFPIGSVLDGTSAPETAVKTADRVPKILTPTSNQIFTDDSQEAYLSWNHVTGAENFEVQFNCVTCKNTSPSTYYVTQPYYNTAILVSGNQFRFRVRTHFTDNSVSEWSEFRYFSYDDGKSENSISTLGITFAPSFLYTDETLKIIAQLYGNEQMQKIEIYVNGALSKTCYNVSSCQYTAGPFSAHYNGQISYYAKAYKSAYSLIYSETRYVPIKERFVIPTLNISSSDSNISATDDPMVTLTAQTNNGTSLDKIELYVNGIKQYTCLNASHCSDFANTLAYAPQGYVEYYAIGYINATNKVIYSPVRSITVVK